MIDGILYDMTGSTPEHGTIATNMLALFKIQLVKGSPCRAYQDQYVAIPNKSAMVPDVVLTCDLGDWDKDKRLKPFKIQSPLIVVEVLSPSTQAYDRAERFARYQSCPTLEVYILINQDRQLVEVYRHETNWSQEYFTQGQTIHLDQLDLEFALDEIYEGIF